MVALHAEDRFYEPDWYFGKHSTDITKRFGKATPSHAYNPEIKNSPTPYHVIPYHDMSDKFRQKLLQDRRNKDPEDMYHGRRATEITSPTKFAQEEKEAPFLPWPEISNRIGDMAFSRHEYLHPLGKTRPSPMDDYVPILRHKRTGKVIGNPSPPPSRRESRRRMLGLPSDGCHNPGSPCRSVSPSPRGGAKEEDDEREPIEDDIGHHHSHGKPKPHDEYHKAASRDIFSPSVPTPARSASFDGDHDDRNHRPFSAPVEVSERQRPRRRKSYLSSTFGNLSSAVQPVGGRSQRIHEEQIQDRIKRNDQLESPYSYAPSQPDIPPGVRYSLGSMSHNAQPVGGRASIINMLDVEQSRHAYNASEHTEASTPNHPRRVETPRNRVYPPQHHSFSQEPSQRNRDDEAFSQHNFKSSRDDRSTTSIRSSRRQSKPPKHDPNLPPEKDRGRSHKTGVDPSTSRNDGGHHS